MKAYGVTTFEAGFNLKHELIKRLNNMDIKVVSIKHYLSSPYQAKRYKPEYVGQECWVKVLGSMSHSVCVTQTDYDSYLIGGEQSLNAYLSSVLL